MDTAFKIMLSLIVLLCCTLFSINGEQCQFEPPCACKTGSGRIDLQPVLARGPLTVSDDHYKYYLDPCKRLSSPPGCVKLTPEIIGCQVTKDQKTFIGLGDLLKRTIVGDPNNGSITFSSFHQDLTPKYMNIKVVCSPSEEDIFTMEPPLYMPDRTVYPFTLKSRYGCLKIPPLSSSDSGLSAGSVLLIIFFVLILVYLVGGVLFLKIVHKAQGAEAIPNIEFWKDFPSLVKDGVMFTCRGCKTESTYEKI